MYHHEMPMPQSAPRLVRQVAMRINQNVAFPRRRVRERRQPSGALFISGAADDPDTSTARVRQGLAPDAHNVIGLRLHAVS